MNRAGPKIAEAGDRAGRTRSQVQLGSRWAREGYSKRSTAAFAKNSLSKTLKMEIEVVYVELRINGAPIEFPGVYVKQSRA